MKSSLEHPTKVTEFFSLWGCLLLRSHSNIHVQRHPPTKGDGLSSGGTPSSVFTLSGVQYPSFVVMDQILLYCRMIQTPLRRVIWREYVIFALFFTFTGAFWVLKVGTPGLVYIFWYKLAGALAILLYLFLWRKKYLFLFYNLGYGKRHVIGWCLAADLLLALAFYVPLIYLRTKLL